MVTATMYALYFPVILMRIINFGEKLYMICRLILHGIGMSRGTK
jgi:hypothetical protein